MCNIGKKMAALLAIVVVFISALPAYSQADGKAKDEAPTKIAIAEGIEVYQHQLNILDYEIEALIVQRKVEKLERILREHIKEMAIVEFGIGLTDEEANAVREEVDKEFELGGINEEHVAKISKKYRAIYDALREWHEDKGRSDMIYEEMDPGEVLTKAEWHLMQNLIPYPEILEQYEKSIPQDIDDLKEDSFREKKKHLLQEKLIDHVVGDVQVEEAEIEALYDEYAELYEALPEYDEIRIRLLNNIIRRKRNEAMNDWLEMRLRRIDIDIKDPQLEMIWRHRGYGGNDRLDLNLIINLLHLGLDPGI